MTTPQQRELDPNTIFLRNIPYSATDEDVKSRFSKYGEIKRVNILTERFRGQTVSRGIGFVEFASPDSVAKALDQSAEAIVINDRKLVIFQARKMLERKQDTIFVQGVPDGVTSDEIKAIFASYNAVDCRIVRYNNERFLGFGFVKLASTEDRNKAAAELKTFKLRDQESKAFPARNDFDNPPTANRRRRFRGRRRFNRGRRAPRNAA